jgi:hypothetical protein
VRQKTRSKDTKDNEDARDFKNTKERPKSKLFCLWSLQSFMLLESLIPVSSICLSAPRSHTDAAKFSHAVDGE